MDRRLDQQFEIQEGPPPMAWAKYHDWLVVQLRELLDSEPSEEECQKFLEQHPCLVPGGDGTGDSFGGHHGAWGDILISQPELPGIGRRIPDFMWLTKNSQEMIPVLIELEAPRKRWLRKDGNKTADLTHAEGQLAEWRDHLDNPLNRTLFSHMYNFPARWVYSHTFAPRYMLIYGRRSEFADQPERNLRRRGLRDRSVETMTFDRLSPLERSSNAICVRVSDQAKRVIAVPPTLQLGPMNAESLVGLTGLEEAISSNELMTSARREFLLGRLSYWIEFGTRSLEGAHPVGVVRPATDRE